MYIVDKLKSRTQDTQVVVCTVRKEKRDQTRDCFYILINNTCEERRQTLT